jgi:adhesin transport system membrane fusion protein
MDSEKKNNSGSSKFYHEADSAYQHYSSRGGRLILWSILIFFVCMVVWASVAEVDQVTRGVGKVIPSRHVQTLQSLEGGIVSKILVHEGDIVDKGQIVIQLDDTQFAAALREGRTHCMEHRATAARLKAEAELTPFIAPKKVLEAYPQFVQQEFELYQARKQQHERQKESLEKELKMMKPLVKEGAVSELDVLKLQRKIDDLEDQYCTESRQSLNEIVAEISRLEESNQMLQDKLKRTKIRAPLKGIVKRVMVKTVGGVIKPGVDLIEIVPLDDTLLVEAKVLPSDIAFLHPGQEVTVKFTAYDYTIYGGLKGKIETISADAIVDETNNSSFYEITVRTEKTQLGSENNSLPIIPGMSVTVDILTGKKTILEYLLKPVMRAKEMALRER